MVPLTSVSSVPYKAASMYSNRFLNKRREQKKYQEYGKIVVENSHNKQRKKNRRERYVQKSESNLEYVQSRKQNTCILIITSKIITASWEQKKKYCLKLYLKITLNKDQEGFLVQGSTQAADLAAVRKEYLGKLSTYIQGQLVKDWSRSLL